MGRGAGGDRGPERGRTFLPSNCPAVRAPHHTLQRNAAGERGKTHTHNTTHTCTKALTAQTFTDSKCSTVGFYVIVCVCACVFVCVRVCACVCAHQVSAFSTWEKELHKIVFDPRYLLLSSEERKQVRGSSLPPPPPLSSYFVPSFLCFSLS